MKGCCSLRIAVEVAKYVGVVLALGFVFTILGVYNTEHNPFWHRLIFWTSTMAVGAGASAAVGAFVWGPRFEDVPAIFKIGGASLIISIPITLLIVTFFSYAPWSVPYLAMQYGYVLIIAVIITTAAYVLQGFRENKTKADPGSDPIASFKERLPIKYRAADVWAISSEDHYLRVHTSLGEELILMRLADAVRELNGADGLQVHRSWWVSKAGVSDEKRVDGRSLLVLESGTEVPVSRSYRAKAKDAGLIR